MKSFFIITIVGLSVSLFSCKKEKDATQNTINNNPIDTTLTLYTHSQVSANINGSNFYMIVGDDDVSSGISNEASVGGYPDTSHTIYSALISNLSQCFIVTKGTLRYFGYFPADTAFKKFFGIGNYNYSLNALNGIRIEYWDVSSHFWSTSLGSANQVGKSFKIEDMLYYNYSGNGAKVRMSFTCTLYDSLGTSINLENGKAILSFCD